MRFALLGEDTHAVALARAVALSSQHELIMGCAIANPPTQLLAAAPGTPWDEPWETLLAPNDVDGVIVARHDDQLLWKERVGRLVHDGMPTLAVHPSCDFIAALEIEALRCQSLGCLLPYTPGAAHPALAALAAWCRGTETSPQGAELLVFERRLADRGPNAVLRQLADDIPLIRQIAGALTQITVVGLDADVSQVASPTVSMSSPIGLEIRWSVLPQVDGAVSQLEAFADGRAASLVIAATTEDWGLSLPGEGPRSEKWNDPAEMIGRFSRAACGQGESRSWADAIVDLEYLEAARSSLAAGRPATAPLDEASSFKASMSVGSCLLLAISIAVLVVWAVIEGIRLPLTDVAAVLAEDRASQASTHLLLRLWPAYPLFAFLLLQLLLFLTRRPPPGKGGTGKSGKV